ncbi:HlyD family secretion protein [Desulfogranum japonicum]|uniref:HlyD family secretion protein n=1 Tax=Desulfogranum japonicum TaxID=231447 RepID=UPI000490CF57|nr:HlyD family secretion protein [Desulfogranum japonicum]
MNDTSSDAEVKIARRSDKQRDPVRTWTWIVLALCVVLIIWYLRADRITPFTSQARVNAMVVPIAPQVAGVVTEVLVTNNQPVEEGQILFRLDDRNYRLAVQAAEAQFAGAKQAMSAARSAIDAAMAQVNTAKANLERANKDAERMRNIKNQDPGAISQRRLEMSEASLASAEGSLGVAQANLQQAIDNYGTEGDRNSRILQAQANLDQAKFNLERTVVKAPGMGVVSGVKLDKGNYATAGSPQMTFIGTGKYWVQADFTENNLGNLKPGMTADLVFDIYPGRVFTGTVREISYGVAVDTTPLGELPTIQNQRSWLREAQRFPVLIDFTLPKEVEGQTLKIGSQVTVVAYTGDHAFFNLLARMLIRLSALLTYSY